ncbi:hypothetical protein BJF86_00125 [Serinicoccus sp. CNJ-927]|uniref:hypothetical protein n=1 Tax=Serinicoccus sp. CNJ-927 TaxID=1904970 RepID=UPI000963F668|nr:hypothetical protein [Serinicoccus sp. CNJ-927]OLT43265.1 hypothetical protein BJF86_00125 [Serinicoccus sp. CNJ-927]
MHGARRLRPGAAALAVAAVLLTGCDGEDGGQDTPDGGASTQGEQEGAQGSGSEDQTDDAAEGEASGESEEEAEPAPPPTEPADIQPAAGDRSVSEDGGTITVQGDSAAFVTPSGNIACVLNGPSATCQLLDKTYDANAEHLVDDSLGDCDIASADAMVLTDASGVWTCPPEPLAPAAGAVAGGWWADEVGAPTTGVEDTDAAVLEYGRTLAVEGASCQSSEDGVTCRSSELGRQFFIARSAYRFGQAR